MDVVINSSDSERFSHLKDLKPGESAKTYNMIKDKFYIHTRREDGGFDVREA